MNDSSHVRIESPAFPADSVQVVTLEGREQLSQLFELHVRVVSSAPNGLDVDAVIGAPATLILERGGVETRRLGGLVAGIRDSLHEETGRMVYDLWFAPRAFRLGLVETYEIFMDVSVPDILRKKLTRAGLQEDQDYELRLTASYPPREFVVQYKETDLAFVSRLAEHLGICFFFEHKQGKDVLVFSDHNSGFAPLVDGREVRFHKRGERRGVFALESHTRMTPAEYVLKDYNYRTPQVALRASSPTERGDGGHVLEYGAHFKSADEGAQLARIRAEEISAGRTIFEGNTDRHGFSAGATLLLEEHPRGDLELLVTEVVHRAATTTLGVGREDQRDYEAHFKAIPYKTPYRPQRLTPKPRIHGVITGVIDAAAKGPYAELDPDGRYRVRFLFDPGEAGEGQASRLVRMAQPHGGGGYGMHFPLRSGVEVILTFVDGDPDRPIILGVVPNPQTPSPVTAGNGTRNVIRTGGGNEINIDDTGGSERIKLSTPKSKTVLQLGAPNAPEDGACVTTDANFTAVASGVTGFVTPALNVASAYYKIKSAADITQFCGVLQNLASVASAWSEAVGTGIGDIKGMFDAADAKSTAFGDKLDEHVEELEHAQVLLDDEIKKDEAALAELVAAADAAPPEQAPAAQAKATEAREALLAKKKDAADKAAHIEKDKVELARFKTKVSDSWAHAASDAVDKAKTVADGASPFISTFADRAGFLAQNEAEALAGVLVASANATSKGGRLGYLVPIVTSPAFTGGGEVSAALIAGVSAFVGGAQSVVAGETRALLTGGTQAAVKSIVDAELHGGVAAFVTSAGRVVVDAGHVGLQMDSIGPAHLHTRGELEITSSDATIRTSRLDQQSADAKLYAKGTLDLVGMKNSRLESEDGSLVLKAASATAELDMRQSELHLTHKGYGAFIQEANIRIGENNKNLDLWVTREEISLNKRTSWCKVKLDYAELKGKQHYVKCDATGVVASGRRIDLD